MKEKEGYSKSLADRGTSTRKLSDLNAQHGRFEAEVRNLRVDPLVRVERLTIGVEFTTVQLAVTLMGGAGAIVAIGWVFASA